jgi:HD-like signal output (HDOD) protein
LFGCQHGDIGASILTAWSFPEALAEAVLFHHRPADCASAGAALLYLAEFWLDPDEDLPSVRHFHAASSRTGITLETLSRAGQGDRALTALLRTRVA